MRLIDTTLGEGGWGGVEGQQSGLVENLDRAGFAALEVVSPTLFEYHAAGGAPSPWDHLRMVRSSASATPLFALVAGQGLIGRSSVADDAVELFVATLVGLGIDGFRVYDPLNDLRNLRVLVESARVAGKRVEGHLCYAANPAHDAELWVGLARQLVEVGCEAVVLRDSGAQLTPSAAGELIPRLIEGAGVPVGVSGWGPSAVEVYRAAAEGGASVFDVNLLGTRVSADEVAGSGIDLDRVAAARAGVDMEGEARPAPTRTDEVVLAELRRHGAEERLDEVGEELGRLLPELGYPPPEPALRRMLATQAVLNVIGGDRYDAVTQELKEYLHGLWGQSPGAVSVEVRRRVLDREQALSIRPADLLQPQIPDTRVGLERADIEPSDENVLLAVLFPQLGPSFFKGEQSSPEMEVDMNSEGPGVGEEEAVEPPAERQVTVSEFDVEVDGEVFRVRVTPAGTTVLAATSTAGAGTTPAPVVAGPGSVLAPMQGLIVKVPVKKGDKVKMGDVVAVLEAMKMQNDIVATAPGTVVDVHVQEGEVVGPKQPLVTIR